MAVATELERLIRTIEEVIAGVNADLESEAVTDEDIRALRTGIETCMMKLDDLRTRLSSNEVN
jgi:hypothetical protein